MLPKPMSAKSLAPELQQFFQVTSMDSVLLQPDTGKRLQQRIAGLSAPGRNCCDVTQTCRPMPPGFEPLPFGNSSAESQRDSVPKPRVASRELPWEKRVAAANPTGVVARWWSEDPTPLGLADTTRFSQGSSRLATLGFEAESLWDSTGERADTAG